MIKTLYFKSEEYRNRSGLLAQKLFDELSRLKLEPFEPIDCDDCHWMSFIVEDKVIDLIVGNEQKKKTLLSYCYVLPTQRVSFLRRLFRLVDLSPEIESHKILEELVERMGDVSDVSWKI
jgi:hypothetical protein